MSVPRQPSIMPLAEHARPASPASDVPNLDFCNAFWGLGDIGVDVLFTRMRSAALTMEKLRTFWRERSAIEEGYSKQLANLAKMPIGKGEIGDLRESLDTLRVETNRQAGFHLLLAQHIRAEMETPIHTFISKQQMHKQTLQVAIEKTFKIKQTREQHVSKARDKYETDRLRIHSYTSKSKLMQDTDLEKIQLKLQRTQQSMEINQRDYVQFTKVLQETMPKWEQDWKTFCDSCQDLEEERMGLLYDVLWAHANNVSEICVSDDNSCERLRIALDHFSPNTDLEVFVRDYGTGNAIPETLTSVDSTNADTPQLSTAQVTTRPAKFVRSRQPDDPPAAPWASKNGKLYDDANEGTATSDCPGDSIVQIPQTSSSSSINAVNGHVSPPQDLQNSARARVDTASACSLSTSHTQLVICDRTWDVDPNSDPKQTKATPVRATPPGEQDPLVKQMEELNMAAAASGNSSKHRDDLSSSINVVTPAASSGPGSPNSPESVLPAPDPPSVPHSISSTPVGQDLGMNSRHRDQVISYVGPLPPARSQVSSQGVSRSSGRGGPSVVANTQPLVPRPPSAAKDAGPVTTMQSHNTGSRAPSFSLSNSMLQRGLSVSYRTVASEKAIGTTLDSGARVVQNTMVQQPIQQVSAYIQPGPLPILPPPAPPPPSHDRNRAHTCPTCHDSSQDLIQQPQPLPSRINHTAAMSSALVGHPFDPDHLPRPPDYHDVRHAEPYTLPAHVNHNNLGPGMRSGHQRSQTIGHVVETVRLHRPAVNTNVYRSTSLEMRRPSPPPPIPPPSHHPPPAWTRADHGRKVLFYVKALYDYTATMEEEFDFQEGDIIAVTQTPEDGWWIGELLDDMRRQPGRHVFPSNFVCLF